jgi:hypothetical protein
VPASFLCARSLKESFLALFYFLLGAWVESPEISRMEDAGYMEFYAKRHEFAPWKAATTPC